MSDFDESLSQRLERHAEADSDAILYRFLRDGETESERLSRGGFAERVRRAAAGLQEQGVTGRPVLLLYPPGLDFAVSFFACLHAGAIAVPALPPDPLRPQRILPRLRAIVHSAEIGAVLTDEESAESARTWLHQAPDLKGIPWIATDTLAAESAAGTSPPDVAADAPAFLQYTSGSTAAPRGTVVTHQNLMHNLAAIAHAFHSHGETVAVSWLPVYHDMGLIGNVLQAAFLGCSCVLMSPTAFIRQPIRWLRAISDYRGTFTVAPNFAYNLCNRKTTPEQREGLDLSSLQFTLNGAEPVRPETLETFAQTFAPHGLDPSSLHPVYGLAEASLLVAGRKPVLDQPPSITQVDSDAFERGTLSFVDDGGYRTVGCGEVALGMTVAIVDPDEGVPVEEGRVGEIWVAGDSVAAGYWRDENATRTTFGFTLADHPGQQFLRTGDLGWIHGGELHVAGRIKDLVIIRGRNHHPQDIEFVAENAHDAIRQGCSAAFALEGTDEERLGLVAEVDLRKTDDEPARIADAVRGALVDALDVRAHLVVLVAPRNVPKTTSGKIQRALCRKALLADRLEVIERSDLAEVEAAEARAAARTSPTAGMSHEELLEAVHPFIVDQLCMLLRLPEETVLSGRTLAELGLDSLAAVELRFAAEMEYEVDVPLELQPDRTTLDDLVVWLVAQIEKHQEPSPA
jgi:acyl-CoA synthetase (AMP-forming)/AMP-acid ligase II/acyl carrier protein